MTADPLFDRALARRNLARALRAGGQDFLLRLAVEGICDRLALVNRDFSAGLDLGTPTSALAEALKPRILARMAPTPETAGGAPLNLIGGEEAQPFAPERFDLVVSALALQGVNDLPGAMIQARRALKPDGLFLACLVGGRSLHELRAALAGAEAELYGGASPRVSPFADVRDMGALLQRAGFALPVADAEATLVRYGDFFALLADLRAMGAANALFARARKPASRALFMRAAEIYAEKFADPDGRLRATFELIYASGWAPHESQQKPLRPGSARMRLADALRGAAVGEEPEP